ncbi:MAG: type II secretion system F family protein [Opitutae bacterium]|jgi:type II secretory pathway component PulF|nr:type II secretion system F family protein [Opitutae bacterium]MBT5910936.1 type II secretion system F family protein [Opitutae bacterium]MBT6851191.1 type II secretion system F family protein [Opitutae bacterium]MBT7741047.1 type II secretion system F family protein [Opitutae bacterium]MBT7925123.1 type II secretion system F family protein [Opitutae bacterium]
MPTFRYVAIDARGRTIPGELEADDRRSVRSHLRGKGLTPVDVKTKGGGAGKSKPKTSKVKTVSKADASTGSSEKKTFSFGGSNEKIGLEFMKRLLELHGSGMPVADSVKLLHQRLSDPQQKEIAGALWRELSEGRSLARAMRLMPDYFGESTSYVIEAGEATGNVAPILRRIIDYLEEKREIKSKVLGSMAYPSFIGFLAFAVVLFFLFYLLPQIQDMLDSLGGELNFMAKALITGSDLVMTLGPFVILGLILAFFAIRQWNKTEAGGIAVSRTVLRIPLIGRIIYYSELFQLNSLLGTLVTSGIGLTENLRLSERTIKNLSFRVKFRSARVLVNEGKSLPEALRKFEFMPAMQLDVMDVGERTGNLAHSLEEIANSFRTELSRRIKRMTTIVTAGALGFAFGLVALVAVSIVTSIFQVSNSITF